MRESSLVTPIRRRCEAFSWIGRFSGFPLSRRQSALFLPYLLALGSSAVALVLMLVTGQKFEKSPYLIYFLAVLLSAWVGGVKPGLLATAITAGFAAFYEMPISEEWAFGQEDIGSTLTYIGVSLLTVLLIRRSRSAIQERRKAEAELQQLNRDLELRVSRRTAAWKQANADLEAFAHSISHDLRTPLRAIDGYARILREDWAPQLDPKAEQYFGHICTNAARMSQMINDLLTFSRLGQKHLSKTEIDMHALVNVVVKELVAMESPERVINIQTAKLPLGWGDSAMLRQVFTNLCSNALKFTRRNPVAQIEIGGQARGAERLYYVRDNGVGFDPAYTGKLFKVFQRLHKVEDFEGTGVGLSLVHRIIQRHGGRVWAEGKVGQGATFSFMLPVKTPNDHEAEGNLLDAHGS